MSYEAKPQTTLAPVLSILNLPKYYYIYIL